MKPISAKVIEVFKNIYPYHRLLNNHNVLEFYLDRCLEGVDGNCTIDVDDFGSETIIIESNDGSMVRIGFDERKIAAMSDGNNAVENEPLFSVYSVGTKIVCDMNHKKGEDVINIESVYDTDKVCYSYQEKVNNEMTVDGIIRSYHSLIGGRELYNREDFLNKKRKDKLYDRGTVDLEKMESELNNYLGIVKENTAAKTL